MTNPYHRLVAEYARFIRDGKSYPLGGFASCPRPPVAADAPKVLLFSPHPDDEVIVGGLALRLLRQSAWNVVNVAVTQASKKERQAERLAELKACCDYIGFGLVQTLANGLEKISLKTREHEPEHWANAVRRIADILTELQPQVIFFPHEADWNSTHIGTHHLVMDALRTLPTHFRCHTVETEFWGAMATPNLMVELAPPEVADLVSALSFHVGEVKRNPYHLSLPAWMVDNVRRGGERLRGQGGAAPDFVFATLYRRGRWANGTLDRFGEGVALSASENPAELFA